jgi:hypothetical protein
VEHPEYVERLADADGIYFRLVLDDIADELPPELVAALAPN